jgi:ABC-type multidrug transport system fused ATPase/permease subunit
MKYLYSEYDKTIILLVTGIIVNIIQTQSISRVIAKIIRSIEKKEEKEAYSFFYFFILLSTLYLGFFYIYKIYQNVILTKLRQWIRHELTRMLLITNNEKLSEINFIQVHGPINRMASVCFMITSDFITFLLPTLLFLLVISGYFLYNNLLLGGGFILGNLSIAVYLYLIWGELLDKNENYEINVIKSESYLLEMLNNIDRIIYRGQTTTEIESFKELGNTAIEKSYDFHSTAHFHGSMMNIIVYCIIFGLLGYIISLYFNKEIKGVFFITLITIIMLYRDKMASLIQQLPDFIEFLGRTNSVMKYFQDLKLDDISKKSSSHPSLPFDVIVFENVSFEYKSSDLLFDNWNQTITLDKPIIGITGNSGRGKSTFVKLILKMYDYTGKISIDGVDIRDLDADYIRQNIVYVNQNAKLFDKKIVENMMYGCHDPNHCHHRLQEIMDLGKYPKIGQLFTNIDIYEKSAGSFGEHLSGGQRQVVNIIGGLIHPASIIILDEPTNAMDAELKKEVIRLIQEFSKEKKTILIITHDKDMYPIFDKKIEL